jgi:hypothetical protein
MQKTLEELENEYADVMSCKAISAVTEYVPPNSEPDFDESSVVERAKKFASEMQKLVTTLFGK